MLKKILGALLCIVISASTQSAAATEWPVPTNEAEALAAYEYCDTVKDDAHELAEKARKFGCSEDDYIIVFAKDQWMDALNRQQEYWIQYQTYIAIRENEEAEARRRAEEEEAARRAAEEEAAKKAALQPTWTGSKLTARGGVNWGPQGKETYYNLYMGNIVTMMRNLGYDATNYPYWVRDDGCKMLGDYIMVAANLNHWPRGTIIECSLGWAIVCDTGGFATRKDGWNWLDIAVNW